TKPVRMGEIVLGRFLGFAFVGTVLMVGICAVSLVFVTRGLDHSHQLDGALAASPGVNKGDPARGEEGKTTFDKYHRHEITLNRDGEGRTDTRLGHWHNVRKNEQGELEIGPPEGMLQAKVPLAGKLRFLDRAGRPAASGINVGNEWAYRRDRKSTRLNSS